MYVYHHIVEYFNDLTATQTCSHIGNDKDFASMNNLFDRETVINRRKKIAIVFLAGLYFSHLLPLYVQNMLIWRRFHFFIAHILYNCYNIC